MISKTGKDKALTKVLLAYALSKLEDDKSWDIALDLYKSAKLLTQETALPYLESLSNQKLAAFEGLKATLEREYKALEQQTTEVANQVLDLIVGQGLTFVDFYKGSLPKHFAALTAKKYNIKFDLL